MELRIHDAPGIAVGAKRVDSRFPTVGRIQRLENKVLHLAEETAKQERLIEDARQDYRDAATGAG